MTNNILIPKREELQKIIKQTTRPNVFDRWDSDTLFHEFDKYMNSEITDTDDDILPYLIMMSPNSPSGGSKSKRLKNPKKGVVNDLRTELKQGAISIHSCMKYKKKSDRIRQKI